MPLPVTVTGDAARRWADADQWHTFQGAMARLRDDAACARVFKVYVGEVDSTRRIVRALLPPTDAEHLAYDADRLQRSDCEISGLLLVAAAAVLGASIRVGQTFRSPTTGAPGSSAFLDFHPPPAPVDAAIGVVKVPGAHGPLVVFGVFDHEHYVVPLTEGAARRVLPQSSELFQQVDDGSLGAPYAWATDAHLDAGSNRIAGQPSPGGPTPKARRIIYDSRRALLDPKRDVIAMNMDRFAADPSALHSLLDHPLAGESLPVLTRSPYACATPVLVVVDVEYRRDVLLGARQSAGAGRPPGLRRPIRRPRHGDDAGHAGRLLGGGAGDAEWIRRARVSSSAHPTTSTAMGRLRRAWAFTRCASSRR